MTEWSPGTAPTTTWNQEAGMAPSDPGTETNLTTLVYRAETAATNAETAETNAETAETNAETAQSAAETAQTAAETAQTAAETAQTAAETAETNAATSATSASTSATTATTKASEASTSATNAATSATAAQTAQTAAEAAQTAAEAAQEAIDGLYLGAQTSDPSVDLNGDAVTAGDWYYNTTTGVTRIYDGSAWNNGAVSTASFLQIANNLSDLNNAATARTNLGLGTAATTASTDYATAAQGTLADSALQSGDSISELTNDAGYSTTTGTVTSVSATVPTGLAVSGTPVTTTGTLAIAYDTGYAIPTTAKQTQWDTAYGWGDHSTAGYLTSFTETNDLSTAVTWANVPDANITQTSVTQHQAALSITESQISDLQSYLTSIAANSVGVSELNLTDGTNGQVLTTNGAGTISFQDAASSGATAGFAIAMAIAL